MLIQEPMTNNPGSQMIKYYFILKKKKSYCKFPWDLALKKSMANSHAEWALTNLGLLYLNSEAV